MNSNNTIFLSSTFRDMHAERDIIHNIVLPELSAAFAESAVNLDFVDLRWGIDTENEDNEQQATQKILQVCFDEIERSKPFFVCFLGERYGWIPRMESIESSCLNAGLSPEQFHGKSITEMEIEFAVTAFEKLDNCYFFFREGLSQSDISDRETRAIYFGNDEAEREKSAKLKARLREKFPERIFPYTVTWDDAQRKVMGLEPLGDFIIECIRTALLEDEDKAAARDEYYKEYRIQSHYFKNTAGATVDRQRYTKPLVDFALGDGPQREAALVAPSGLGKSSLLSLVSDRLEETGAYVLKLSAGLTANSLDFRFAVRYLYTRLAADFQVDAVEGDYAETKQALYSLLSNVSRRQRVVILIDALNQFNTCEEVRTLDWINELFIPENVRVLYSALPGLFDDVFLKRDVYCLNLEELDNSEITAIAGVTAKKFHKQLSQGVLEALCDKRDDAGEVACRIPLYLSMFIEYIADFDMEDYLAISEMEKQMGGAHAISEYIRNRIRTAPSDVARLFDAVSLKCAKHIGEGKNEFITTLLGQSRFGVREADICAVAKLFGIDISPADFSLYRKMFRMHLVQRNDGRWDFSHWALRSTVRESGERNVHSERIRELTAQHFLSLDRNDVLRQSELMYYLAASDKLSDIRRLFGDELVSRVETTELKALLCADEAGGKEDLLNRYFAVETPQDMRGCLKTAEHIVTLTDRRAIVNARDGDVRLFVRMIAFLLKQKKECEAALLTKAYGIGGAIFLNSGDKRHGVYFDLCLGLTERLCPEKIGEHYSEVFGNLFRAGEYRQAAQVAAAYCRAVRRLPLDEKEKREVLAQALYLRALATREAALLPRLSGAKRYLRKASKLISPENELRPKIAAAMELSSAAGTASAQSEAEAAAQQAIAEGDRLVKKDRVGAVSYYEQALEGARLALIEKEDLALLCVYQTATQRLAYLMASDASSASRAAELFFEAQRLCKTIYYMTEDAEWSDRRVELIEDAARLSQSSVSEREQREAVATTATIAEKRLSSYRSEVNQIAHRVVIFMLIAAFPVALVGVPLLWAYKAGAPIESAFNMSRLLLYFDQFLQWFSPPLMALTVFQVQQNLSERYTGTVRYCYGYKKAWQYGALYAALLLFAMFFNLVTKGLLLMDFSEENLKTVFTEGYYYLLNASIVFCVVWCGTELVRLLLTVRKAQKEDGYIRNRYCHRPYIKRYAFAAARRFVITLIVPLVLYIGFCSGADFGSLTYWGSKIEDVWKYHWVLPCLEAACGVLSLLWLLLRGRKVALRGCGVRRAKQLRPMLLRLRLRGVGGVLLTIVCAATLVVGGRYVSQLRDYSNYLYEDGFYYKETSEGVTIYGYDGDAADLTVPDMLAGEPVTKIGRSAFCESASILKKVTLPQRVHTIEKDAFAGCVNLVSVTFGKQVRSIEENAFYGCTSLAEIRVPGSLRTMGEAAFRNCTSLGAVYIEDGLTALPEDAFYGCTALRTLRLPETLLTVDRNAFDTCSALETLELPNSVETVGIGAFSDCDALEELYIPDNTRLGYLAFDSCDSLRKVSLGANIDIDNVVFRNCAVLTEIFTDTAVRVDVVFQNAPLQTLVFGDAAESVPEYCASSMYELKTVTLGKNIRSIGSYAFSRCRSLETIHLNGALETIGGGAFDSCDALQTVNIPSVEAWCNIQFVDRKSNPARIPGTFLVDGQPLVSLTIPVSHISDYAFYGITTLTEVTVPAYVESIGCSAFYACPNLKTVNVLDLAAFCAVEFEDAYANPLAMYHDANVMTYRTLLVNGQPAEVLKVPDTVTEIKAYAFADVVGIREVHIPSSVKSIGTRAFDSVDSLYIEDLVSWLQVDVGNALSAGALYVDGKHITTLVVPQEITVIPADFLVHFEVERVVLHEGITHIGKGAFCRYIEAVELPSIEAYCRMVLEDNSSSPTYNAKAVYFDGVKAEGTLVVPDTVTRLGAYAFSGLRSVTKIVLPEGLTDIDENAFKYCDAQVITAP